MNPFKKIFEKLPEIEVPVYCHEIEVEEGYYSPTTREYKVRPGRKATVCEAEKEVMEKSLPGVGHVLEKLGLDFYTIMEIEEKYKVSPTAQRWLKEIEPILRRAVRRVAFKPVKVKKHVKGTEPVRLEQKRYIIVEEVQLPKPDLKRIEEEWKKYWKSF